MKKGAREKGSLFKGRGMPLGGWFSIGPRILSMGVKIGKNSINQRFDVIRLYNKREGGGKIEKEENSRGALPGRGGGGLEGNIR